MTLRSFIARWRESHVPGWHDTECCVNELLDELEKLDDAKTTKAGNEVLPRCGLCKVENVDGQEIPAAFILNGAALCYRHWSALK